MVAVDDGNEHTISVWEWQKGERGHKITETKVRDLCLPHCLDHHVVSIRYDYVQAEQIVVIFRSFSSKQVHISIVIHCKVQFLLYFIPTFRHWLYDVLKLQVAILARSPRKMSQTDRILPRYILSRVRVSVRPRIFYTRKNPQTTVARPAAVNHRSAADKQLNWNGHNPFSWVAQRQELSAKTLLRSAAIRVQTQCREQYFFHFYCLRLTRLTFNKSWKYN